MCVYSMVMDHYRDRWAPQTQPILPVVPWPSIQPIQPLPEPRITQAEVDEFRRLLDRARKYDREHGEPDCELAEKKAALKALADQLGIDIAFVDEASP